jgi:hypothetical protein
MAYDDVVYEIKNQVAWITSEEAKEMARSFNAKDKPNAGRFYR